MFFKSKLFQLCVALGLGLFVLLLPRPEGTRFKIKGDPEKRLHQAVEENFTLLSADDKKKEYVVQVKDSFRDRHAAARHLEEKAKADGLTEIQVGYVDGLPPRQTISGRAGRAHLPVRDGAHPSGSDGGVHRGLSGGHGHHGR